MDEKRIIKDMLNTLRAHRCVTEEHTSNELKFEHKEEDNFLSRGKVLMEEAVDMHKKKVLKEEGGDEPYEKHLVIDKNTPQFGDIRSSQEEMIRKTISDNVSMDSDALKYYPKADDITLDGKIPSLNMSFQFRFADPSGDGCYIWTDALQVTDSNLRTIGKVRDAFLNWRQGIIQDADLMEKLKKASEKDDEL